MDCRSNILGFERMNSFALFTDVSLNPQRKLGVGGYLLVPVSFLENEPHDIEIMAKED